MTDLWSALQALFFSGQGIKPKRSNMHLLMPTVVICILVVLLVIMIVQRAMKCKKEGTPFFHFKGYRFFEKDFHPVIFFGSLALMVIYFWLLPVLHFTASSMLILFILNILYTPPFVFEGKKIKAIQWKSLAVSVIISVVAPLLVYLLFGVVFGLTLP